MKKNILNLGKALNKNTQKEITGGGGHHSTGNSTTTGTTLTPKDPDYWTPGGKYACYTRYENPNSFSHISLYDETGKVYICWPY
ncbi:hypothetical protein ACSIGC_17760 [Tenacibaculum sp. ZS6-P6]|uniref:hypothetical protein n=1 Tax=Tenacibaculum sp. ZS6-P6 TaxID=3447503 RepID=UPI003F9C013E